MVLFLTDSNCTRKNKKHLYQTFFLKVPLSILKFEVHYFITVTFKVNFKISLITLIANYFFFLRNNYVFSLHQLIPFITLYIKVLRY